MIKLPEKAFFTIPQLALRWNVDESEINHLIETGLLSLADKNAALKGKSRTVFVAQDPHLSDEEQNTWLQEQLALHEKNNEEVIFVPISDEFVPFWDEVMYRYKSNYPDSKVKVVLIKDIQELEVKYGGNDIVVNIGKRQKQLNTIMSIISEFDFITHAIPDKGKAKIEICCLENHKDIFTESGFEHAWKEGLKKDLFKTANHDIYSQKK